MPGTNTTRDEASERARLLRVDSYDVWLDVTTSDTTFRSRCIIRFSCAEPGASTFADLVGATITEMSLNGIALGEDAYADDRIALENLQPDNELVVEADLPFSRTGEGLHRFVDPADKLVYLYSQFEVPDARKVFATFEQPNLKGLFTFHLTAPKQWQVASNSPTPPAVDLGLGNAVWHFATTPKLSTYVTAIVAGDYAVVEDVYHGQHGELPIRIFVRQSLRQYLDSDEIFEVTKQGLAYFEQAFEMAYPFEKYDQLFVPEFNMGAMENAGCVTIRDEYVFRSRQTRSAYETRANTILHEMAHMWFGDLVTMKWWDDLWLNESFAEWAAYQAASDATRYSDSWTAFCNARKMWAYRQDQLPSTHPIAADNVDLAAVEVNFDGITYAKGASALRQLVAWVGHDHFLEGLRAYFDAHAFGNTELDDLLSALEQASGRDLRAWTKEWLQTSGVNTMRASFEVDDAGMFTAFTVEQSAIPDYPTLRRHRLAIGLYDVEAGALVRRDSVELDVSGASTHVEALIGVRQPDLVLLNDRDLTYAKVRLDDRSLSTLLEHLDGLDDSLARALCYGAAWDMTRDAEMRTTDWVALVSRGIVRESDITAVRGLLARTTLAIVMYADHANQAALQQRWEQALTRLLSSSEPGSDRQLAFVTGLASAAHGPDTLRRLEEILRGTSQLEGLVVDHDLRWKILAALAREGTAAESEIADELDTDTTISGQEAAAGARASMPTAEAKRRAWDDTVGRDDLPNETMRSIVASFHQPYQDDVLRPYIDEFLTMADTVWERRGTHSGTTILQSLFPRLLASEDAVARVDDWLDTTSAHPSAKRLILEGRDDMVRALRARARDATPG